VGVDRHVWLASAKDAIELEHPWKEGRGMPVLAHHQHDDTGRLLRVCIGDGDCILNASAGLC
jgi:hypothetical protein